MNRQHLPQLSADLDRVINLRSYDDEDESHLLRNTGAVGTLGVGGAYLRGKQIPVNAPGGLLTAAEAKPGAMGTLRRAAGTVAQGGRALAGDLGLPGIKETFMKGYSREGGGVLRGVRGVARKLTKGRSAAVGLSARHEQLVNLSGELDQVIEFDLSGVASNIGKSLWRGTTGRAALKWGGIGAAGGAVVGGISSGLSDDPNKGVLSGALGGAVAGGALGAIGGGGMRAAKTYGALGRMEAKAASGITKEAVAGMTPKAAAAPAASATAAADQMAAKAASPAAQATGKPSAYAQMPDYQTASIIQPRHVSDPMGYGIGGNTINPLVNRNPVARTTSALRDPNTSVADALTNKRKNIYENGMNTTRGMKSPTVFSSRHQSLVQLSAELDKVITT